MAARVRGNHPESPRMPPATTPEAREKQLIALAVDRVEQQIRDGTASSQVLTHYLKLGSSREKLEQLRISYETELMAAKSEAMASAAKTEEMYAQALQAMRSYSGQDPLESPDEEEDLP